MKITAGSLDAETYTTCTVMSRHLRPFAFDRGRHYSEAGTIGGCRHLDLLPSLSLPSSRTSLWELVTTRTCDFLRVDATLAMRSSCAHVQSNPSLALLLSNVSPTLLLGRLRSCTISSKRRRFPTSVDASTDPPPAVSQLQIRKTRTHLVRGICAQPRPQKLGSSTAALTAYSASAGWNGLGVKLPAKPRGV